MKILINNMLKQSSLLKEFEYDDSYMLIKEI